MTRANIVSFFLGLTLAAFAWLFFDKMIYYSPSHGGGYYYSPCFPMAYSGDSPGAEIVRKFDSQDYWDDLSESLALLGKKYCEDEGFPVDVFVSARGDITEFVLFYAYEGSLTTGQRRSLEKPNGLRKIIVDQADLKWCEALDEIKRAESGRREVLTPAAHTTGHTGP